MPRQLEHCSDEELASLIKDGLDWDETGVLPNGVLRIEADRIRETYPDMPVAYSRKLCREAALREAAIRWMKLQGFTL